MIKVFIFLNDGYRDIVALLLNHLESIKVVGSSGDINHLEEKIEASNPDVILIGHAFTSGTGIQAIETLKNLYPKKKVIAFTNAIDRSTIIQSVEAGADGYVLMTTPMLKLIDYIKDAYEGGAPMSPSIARQILNALVPVNNVNNWNSEGLTAREIDILRLLVKGHSYKLVSYDLKISIDTVRSHIKNIYSKLNVNSKSEAIIKVLKDRLIP